VTTAASSVELSAIRKYFPSNGVEALASVNFNLVAGEIHALIGENGAGKSTLMHVMAGVVKPSSGKISLDGNEYSWDAPSDALRAGIGMVRQHPRLVPGFRLWEDCVLGAEAVRWSIMNRVAARNRVNELSCRWGFNLDPDALTDDLATSQRQKAAILALLLRKVRFLIFDEPSAVLAPAETDRLFDLLRNLREEGRGIVLISHKLDETLTIADRVTVIRQGRTIATLPARDTSVDMLRGMMFGEMRVADKPLHRKSTPPCRNSRQADRQAKAPVLDIRSLVVQVPGKPYLRGINLALWPGMIHGIAGVRDSGPETLELAIAGMIPPVSGEIEVLGKRISGNNPKSFRQAGGAWVPADRTGVALALRLPLQDNMVVHAVGRALRNSIRIMSKTNLRRITRGILSDARVTGDPRQLASGFSGGTLQRAVLARELAENAAFLLLSEPGWGLDLENKAILHHTIAANAARGTSILLISTDLDELISLSDTISVMRNGNIVATFQVPDPDTIHPPMEIPALREAIGAAMTGSEACADVG